METGFDITRLMKIINPNKPTYKFKIDYYQGSEWEGQRTIYAASREEALEKLWQEVRSHKTLTEATRDFDIAGVEEITS